MQQQQQLDADYLASDDFVDRVVDILAEVARTADESRLVYLRRFLVACSLLGRPDATWVDLFTRYTASMSGAHLLVLEAYYEAQRNVAVSDRLGSVRIANVPLSLDDIKTTYDGTLLRVLAVDLANQGLLVDWRFLTGDSAVQPQAEYSLTRNGLAFMKFLLAEWHVNLTS